MSHVAPTLAELTARFLAQAPSGAASGGEVTPHEIAGGFRASASDLWREAFVAPGTAPSPCPADWASFAESESALGAVPCAAGLFPQRVRNLADVSNLGCVRVKSVDGFNGLKSWAARASAGADANLTLVAAGVLAGLGDGVGAQSALANARRLGGETAAYWNQLGATAWLAGDSAAAESAWRDAGDHAPARFNLGLAALVAGRSDEARVALASAASRMPASSGWGHLARLYSALAA